MPYDEQLAARLKQVVETRYAKERGLSPTHMFGGYGYLLNGNMCIGIHKDTLIVRVGVDNASILLDEAHVRPMDLTGKVMTAWATIEPEAMHDDDALARYCGHAIAFVKTLPAKKK